MGSRHAARQVALQALYALDANPATTAAEAVDRAGEEGPGAATDRAFVERLVHGAWAARDELDAAIQRHSRRWRLDRMDRVDRSVMRLAVFELLHAPDTPAPVVLDEGVELAKEFGGPDSPSFVNGILDRIAHEYRPGELDGRER